MSFFDAFTEGRAQLAFHRTKRNIDDGLRYLSKHQVETAVVIGSLVPLMLFMPASVMLSLLVSAFVLICFNLLTPPSHFENAENLMRRF